APLGSAPTEHWREMLEVNVLGLAIATREAIQDMERRGAAGHVVHVASMAAHRVPGPESGMYAATKFAVRALTEALRQELRAKKSPIRVTAVSPGHVFTEFADVFTGTPGAQAAIDGRFKILEPRDVAEAIVWVVSSPPAARATRSLAMRTYSGTMSAPAARRPCLTAAHAVLPTPRYGSTTRSPGAVSATMKRSTSSTGNWHGWIVFSTWLAFTLGKIHTSPGFFPRGCPLYWPAFFPFQALLPGYFCGTRTGSRSKA